MTEDCYGDGNVYLGVRSKDSYTKTVYVSVGKFAKFTDGIWREVTNTSPGIELYMKLGEKKWIEKEKKD